MKRVKVTQQGVVREFFAEDPTEHIALCVGQNIWGLPERPELDAEGNPTGVMLPAEYTVEITDITYEHDLQVCISNRKAEYPTPEEFMNAFFDGGEVELQALNALRLAVKAKYPKPTQGEI